MFYGDSVLKIDNSSQLKELSSYIQIESDNFINIFNSLNILNENQVIHEVNIAVLLERIKNFFGRFLGFIKKIIGKIKEKIIDISNKKLIDKIVDWRFENVKEGTEVGYYRINDKFYSMLTSKALPAIEKYAKYISLFADELDSSGYLQRLDFVEEFDFEIYEKIKSLFDDFGGIDNIDIKNKEMFHLSKTENKEEMKINIKKDLDDIGKKCLKVYETFEKATDKLDSIPVAKYSSWADRSGSKDEKEIAKDFTNIVKVVSSVQKCLDKIWVLAKLTANVACNRSLGIDTIQWPDDSSED